MDTKELDEICIKLIEKRKEKDKLAKDVKELNKEVNNLEFKIAGIFKDLGKIENSGTWGRVKIKEIVEYKVTNKEDVYEWLKKEGRFDDLSQIHAGTLKRVIKEEVVIRRTAAQESNSKDFAELKWTPVGVEENKTFKAEVSSGD